MARVKNIEAFCTVCNTITKMELAGNVSVFDQAEKRWAKCKKCKQMRIIEIPTNGEADKASGKFSVDNIEVENSSEYSPRKSFIVGESIYHKMWDDYGMVVSKESSNGRTSITVEFQKSGSKRLIESIL